MSDRKAVAAVVRALGEAPALEEVPWPPLGKSGMVARVEAATICGTDVKIWREASSGALLPYIPGHETAGIVVEMAARRADIFGTEIAEGDRIIWAYPFCGSCFYCKVAAQPTMCGNTLRFGRGPADQAPYLLGGCATHQYVPPESGVVKIPSNVSSELAASASCALRTVVHAFERLGTVRPEQTCLIQGCGPVGLYATAMANRVFSKVVVIGAPTQRLKLAKKFGASATLNVEDVAAEGNRRDWVMDETGGRGPDVVIQCAGAAAVPEGLRLVRAGGAYVSIGGGGRATIEVDSYTLTAKMLRIIGVRSGEARHFYGALRFISTNQGLPFSEMITGKYLIKEVGEALVAMEGMREIKPVVVPTAEVGAA